MNMDVCSYCKRSPSVGCAPDCVARTAYPPPSASLAALREENAALRTVARAQEAEAASLEAAAGRMRAALLRLEWSGTEHHAGPDQPGYVECCPECRRPKGNRHAPDCALGMALAPGAGKRAARVIAAAETWYRAAEAWAKADPGRHPAFVEAGERMGEAIDGLAAAVRAWCGVEGGG